MDTPDVVASIWNCTSCRDECPAEFATTVNTIRPDAIVTIAARDTIGMPPSRPTIAKCANVSEIALLDACSLLLGVLLPAPGAVINQRPS